MTFSAAGSSDVHGPITDYRWDLNGSGKFETDSGSTPTVTTSFAAAGEHTVSVRESDASGNTATATLTQRVVTIGVSNYEEAVLGTPSLLHFYPLGEATGPTIKDVKAGRQRHAWTKSSTARPARSTVTPPPRSTSPARATPPRASRAAPAKSR